jgi:hypothetical protein
MQKELASAFGKKHIHRPHWEFLPFTSVATLLSAPLFSGIKFARFYSSNFTPKQGTLSRLNQ